MHRARERLLLFLILASFVAFGLFYSITTPIFEAPDEVWHYAYVREIATRRGFPIVIPHTGQPWEQEGSQPPLYYTLGAAMIAWINPDDLENLPTRNPFARIGEPAAGSHDNRNAFIHTAGEDFPYRGTALAVHILRLFSIALGAATVALTYALAREVFPGNAIIGYAAAGFVAFLPQFLFIGSAINNDNLATMLAAATLWQLARAMRRGLDDARAAILGALVGGALLAKFSTATLAPLTLLVIFALAAPKRDWRGAFRLSTIFAAIAALIAGWWYLRNWMLYGDPTALSLVLATIGERAAPLNIWRWFIAENEGLRLSSWGVFGWMNILASREFYAFFDALAIAGIIGIAFAIARRQQLSFSVAILGLWCVVGLAALVRYNFHLPASQGRLLFPTLPAWAVLWGWGITSLAPARFLSWVTASIASAQAIAAILAPVAFIAPAYAPTVLAENAIPANALRLDWRFDHSEWIAASADRAAIRPGESLNVTLYQRIPAPPNRGAAIFIHVVNSADIIVAQRDSLIGSGNPHALPASGIVADSYRIAIPITASAPDEWRIQAGMYDPVTGKRFVPTGRTAGAMTLATLRAEKAPAWNFDFDGHATLLDAGFDRAIIPRGGALRVKLNWSAARGSPRVFIHALGENDRIWASADAALEGVMQVELRFDPRTPPGVYPLELGVYPAPDGDRVAVFDANGQLIGDRIFIGPVRITNQ